MFYQNREEEVGNATYLGFTVTASFVFGKVACWVIFAPCVVGRGFIRGLSLMQGAGPEGNHGIVCTYQMCSVDLLTIATLPQSLCMFGSLLRSRRGHAPFP